MSKSYEQTSEVEAAILVHYFFRTAPDNSILRLYTKAVHNGLPQRLDSKDLKLLNFGFSHPMVLPMLDAGLAILRPEAELRRRIYMMFAILESMPQYSDKFLSKQRPPLFIITIVALLIRAVLRTLSGIFLIKVLRA